MSLRAQLEAQQAAYRQGLLSLQVNSIIERLQDKYTVNLNPLPPSNAVRKQKKKSNRGSFHFSIATI